MGAGPPNLVHALGIAWLMLDHPDTAVETTKK